MKIRNSQRGQKLFEVAFELSLHMKSRRIFRSFISLDTESKETIFCNYTLGLFINDVITFRVKGVKIWDNLKEIVPIVCLCSVFQNKLPRAYVIKKINDIFFAYFYNRSQCVKKRPPISYRWNRVFTIQLRRFFSFQKIVISTVVDRK